MPVRYVFAPIIGSGTRADPFRLSVSNYPLREMSAVIPSNPDGTPKLAWGFAIIDADDMTPIEADPEIDIIPLGQLDRPLTDMSQAQRNAVYTKLDELGVPRDTVLDTWTLRQLVHHIATWMDPLFNPGALGTPRARGRG